jgi:hypothetical protein
MKKLIYISLFFAGCRPVLQDGTYVNHSAGRFSIADDTLIVNDTVIMNKTGYQKIRNGKALSKAFKVRSWTLNSPNAPAMQFSHQQITIGQTIYQRIP